MSQLHCSILPGSALKKELLTFGFIRFNSLDSVPFDIVQICKDFYDEALQWHIHCTQLQQFVKNNMDKKHYLGPFFACNGIKMRWIMDPVPQEYIGHTVKVIEFNLQLHEIAMKDIIEFTLYIVIFCPQNGASFARVLEQNGTNLFWNEKGISSPFHMILDYTQYEHFQINHYIQVLRIKYKNGNQYIKPIKLKKHCHFKWIIDGLLMEQMKTAVTQQMFYSNSFGAEYNNWCLCLFPMGQSVVAKTKDRKCGVVLRLFKFPPKVKNVTVLLEIKNSNSNKKMSKELVYNNKISWDELLSDLKIDLFSSSLLARLDSLTVILSVTVCTVNGNSKEENWEQFGVI